jgi:RNA recognition motif-containing protein
MQGNKLYVGNLSYSVTENQLRELFSQYGKIQDVVIIKDSYTDKSKGFGFVEFSNPSEAQKAATELNGKEYESRALKVNEAKQRPERNNKRGGFRNRY